MISIAFGSLCLVIGILMAWNLLRGSRRQVRKRRADTQFFKSLEVEAIEAPANNAWAARATFQKGTSKPQEFDLDLDEEEIRPIGLTAPGPFDPPGAVPSRKSAPNKGIGFTDADEEDDGPRQGTLGF